MKPLLLIGAAVALALPMGCATDAPTTPSAVVTTARKKAVATERMRDGIEVGRSTRADVAARLGETLAISFDNGYEIWVYRLASARDAELVILFDPSGVVAKTRLRPSPPRA